MITMLFSVRLPLHPNLLFSMRVISPQNSFMVGPHQKLDIGLIAHPGANRKLTIIRAAEAPFYTPSLNDHPLAAQALTRR